MSGRDEATDPLPDGPSPGLLRKLVAAIRPEFRADILRFDASDPVFGGPLCRVPTCPRPARSRGLCSAHIARWRRLGRPGLDEFAATTDSEFAHVRLIRCQAPGCGYGVNGHGLCGRHLGMWRRSGRPERTGWLAEVPPTLDPQPTCPAPGCDLWAQPSWPFCRSHGRSWIDNGRPDVADHLARFCDDVDDGVPAHERINLHGLALPMKLEMQYVLQCRRDDQALKTRAAPVSGVVRFLLDSQVTSFLDWPEQTWKQRILAANGRGNGVQAALVIYARRRIEDLAYGRGWEVEYPRDTWRLNNLGIDGTRANISFEQIPQPWLKDLAKRWARWRLTTGKGSSHVGNGVLAVTRFAIFLGSPEVNANCLADVDRALLERYLAPFSA